LPRVQALQVLEADIRPPIRRGDLDTIPAGSTVAIIDGIFDQDLSVSPTEIRAAIRRGVRVYGASSMGALRAVEVPGVHGVGRIYDLYRSGAIECDDEVALAFDPETLRPLSEPLVNVRHAVERLAKPGTISRRLAAAVVRAARRLPYAERTYPRILEAVGLQDRAEAVQLAAMLASYDLKREDALTLLEQLSNLEILSRLVPTTDDIPGSDAPLARPCDAVHCWEFGPPLLFRELVDFMALTGSLSNYGPKAAVRLGEAECPEVAGGPTPQALLDRLLAQTARAWNWVTEEEVEISLADLGLRQNAIEGNLRWRLEMDCKAMALTRVNSERFFHALRVELFFDDLALKREAARAVSLRWLANQGQRLWGPTLSEGERRAAERKLCQVLDVRDLATAVTQLGWWGLSPDRGHQFVTDLAFARRPWRPVPASRDAGPSHPWLRSSPKVPGSRRFCTTASQAYAVVKRLQPAVGVTRVAVITGLGTIGIPNAQAFRPDGEWSSTVGSGKSESTLGAKVGAVMEEIEKWAQEEFTRRRQDLPDAWSSFAGLCWAGRRAVDPATLDLPYDTCYTPELEIGWHACTDIAAGSSVLVPMAAVTHRRVPSDIYFSQRGGRKTVTTNGLASGLTIAEALTHALCEYIERHARAVEAITEGNPGGPHPAQRPFVDLETVPRSTRRLVSKVFRAGHRLAVRDITSEIAVPTFSATILLSNPPGDGGLFGEGWQRATGWAAHPDSETAVNMAILEASQTVMTHVAGAREDLALQARSLGRHERTDCRRRAAAAADLDVDVPRRAFASISGFSSSDAAEDVRWVLKRLNEAGYAQALVVDYSVPRIKPVKVVRAIVPGLETINPFHTGAAARRGLLSDLLP
jgi:ribosomal protein S12 methylthiotransferase accessory factor